MATPRKKKEETTVVVSTAPVPAVIAQPKSLVLEGDPEAQLAYAQKAANALMKVVKPKDIGGKQYLMFGAWQTLGRFFGSTVGVEWTSALKDEKGFLLGYEARAIVYQNGQMISSAEASCMTTEKRWRTADEYAIKSMAQTRASAKALRNAYGWVAELAGYESTPAEEMSYDISPVRSNAKVTSTTDDIEVVPESAKSTDLICSDTGVAISQAEFDYSTKFYGRALSRAAQQKSRRIR